jgi:hypothetical protein
MASSQEQLLAFLVYGHPTATLGTKLPMSQDTDKYMIIKMKDKCRATIQAGYVATSKMSEESVLDLSSANLGTKETRSGYEVFLQGENVFCFGRVTPEGTRDPQVCSHVFTPGFYTKPLLLEAHRGAYMEAFKEYNSTNCPPK